MRARWWSLLLLTLLPVASVQADAIMPFDGECPPGHREGISSHAEVCIAQPCESDGDCGEGAHCVTLCTCRAEREIRTRHHPEPEMREMEVGLCSDGDSCAEGEVVHRRQCEPTAPTPAFDPERHSWTGVSHPTTAASAGGASESEPGEDDADDEDDEEESGSFGCAVSHASGGWAPIPLAFAVGVALRRRRRCARRAAGRARGC